MNDAYFQADLIVREIFHPAQPLPFAVKMIAEALQQAWADGYAQGRKEGNGDA